MAKKIKWQEGARASRITPPAIELIWMKPGTLADLIIVERQGTGWGSEKRVKVIDKVVLLSVVVPGVNGWCEILRGGRVETAQNRHLRPTAA